MTLLFQPPAFLARDANGAPVSGAKLFLYVTGTTQPLASYTDAGFTTLHPWPVVADSSGVFPSVYVNAATLKVLVTTPNGAALPGYPVDGVDPEATFFTLSGALSDETAARVAGDAYLQSQFNAFNNFISVTDPDDLTSATFITAGGTAERTVAGKAGEWLSVEDFTGTNTQKFQAAINALPDAGGIILVPQGDYSDVGALTIPEVTVNTRLQRKMVTWLTRGGGSLPRELPGMVLRSGQHREWGSTGRDTGRFGDAFLHVRSEVHKPNPASQNQQDAIHHAELYVENDTGGVDHEMIAYKFDATNKDGDAASSVRGIRGSVTGDGGAGKMRAVRVVAKGQGGHAGVLTGVMAAVYRTGPEPVAFGGDGVTNYAPGSTKYGSSIDFAFVAQAGAGARGCFFAEGVDGGGTIHTPQTVFAQSGTLQPTIAVIDVHTGGPGRIMRILGDDLVNQVAGIESDARAYFPAFRSNVGGLVVADDAVGTFTLPASATTGWLKFWASGTGTIYGEIYYRTGDGSEVRNIISEGGGVDYATAGVDLTGTTGVDGQVTVSVVGTAIKVENRSGASRTFFWHLVAA
jgi:hypothetical protein